MDDMSSRELRDMTDEEWLRYVQFVWRLTPAAAAETARRMARPTLTDEQRQAIAGVLLGVPVTDEVALVLDRLLEEAAR